MLAGGRVRIWESVESAPEEALESVSRVFEHRFRVACSKYHAQPVLVHTRANDSEPCIGTLVDFRTEPKDLTRLPANPTLRAAQFRALEMEQESLLGWRVRF